MSTTMTRPATVSGPIVFFLVIVVVLTTIGVIFSFITTTRTVNFVFVQADASIDLFFFYPLLLMNSNLMRSPTTIDGNKFAALKTSTSDTPVSATVVLESVAVPIAYLEAQDPNGKSLEIVSMEDKSPNPSDRQTIIPVLFDIPIRVDFEGKLMSGRFIFMPAVKEGRQ